MEERLSKDFLEKRGFEIAKKVKRNNISKLSSESKSAAWEPDEKKGKKIR